MSVQLDTYVEPDPSPDPGNPDPPNPDPDNPDPDNPNPDNPNPGNPGEGTDDPSSPGAGDIGNVPSNNNGNSGNQESSVSGTDNNSYNNADNSDKQNLLLAKTGDFGAQALAILFLFSSFIVVFIYVSRRRAVREGANNNLCFIGMSNKSERIIAIVLSLSLAFAGLIFGIKAYADSENIEDSVKTSVVASSKVVVDSQGKIKSTTLDISNKLNTAVTVGSVSAPTELSAWVANIENNAVVDKGATLNKTWTPDSETIPASILSILTTGSGKTELNFNANIAYSTWTVKWNSNGGNEPTQSETVIDGNSASLPASGPTRINYSFDSWNTSADGNGKTITAEYLANNVIAADTEFFAKWAPQSFDIAYHLDEGRFPDGIDAPNSYTYGIGLSKLPQPVRDGYDFLGWFDSSEGGNEISEISSESSGGIELFAHWRLSTNTPYTVKHLKQNIDDDDYTLADTDNLAGTTGEKTKAVAKAYDGFTAQSFSQVDIASNGTSVVEIKYDRNKYNVTFNLMGEGSADEGDIETQRVKYEGKVVKPKDPTPTPDSGRKFGGWYPLEDYSGDAFNFETPVTGDINLYAKWMNENEAIYTVRHLQQNIDNDDYTVVSVDTETKTGNVGEKTQASAKTYEGFSSAKNFNQETITADGNTVVDIYYDRLTYIVVYDLQGRGDGVPDPLTVRYDGKLVKPSDPTSPAGYTFEGWVLKSQDTETAFDFASTTVKSGLRLYAKWSPVKYTVIFDKNSNSATGNMPNQELTYDEFHNLYANTFTFSMNLFKGWSLSATGDVAYHDEQLVKNLVSTATSITLYAKWEATPEAFLAPSYIDPYQVLLGNISSKVITLDEVKTIATSLSKGEANPDQTIYNATNDAYHLFAKIGGTGENKDDWLECRIIHVGPHDGDGSG